MIRKGQQILLHFVNVRGSRGCSDKRDIDFWCDVALVSQQWHAMSHCVTMTDKVSSREALDCHEMSRKSQQSSAHINNHTHITHHYRTKNLDLDQSFWPELFEMFQWHFVWCHGMSGKSLRSSIVTDLERALGAQTYLPPWCHQNVIIAFKMWSGLWYKSQAKAVCKIYIQWSRVTRSNVWAILYIWKTLHGTQLEWHKCQKIPIWMEDIHIDASKRDLA